MSNAAAGWYPDPTMPATQRYWDGARWSEHVAPLPPPAQHQQQQQPSTGLALAGVVSSLLLPIVGFVIGIVLLLKNDIGVGIACLVLSVVAAIFWTGMFSGSYA